MAVGYKTLVQNLSLFKELDSLPFKVDFAALDDGCGLAARGLLKVFRKIMQNGKRHVS